MTSCAVTFVAAIADTRDNAPRSSGRSTGMLIYSKKNTGEEVRAAGGLGSRVCNGRNEGYGAGGHLQPRLLRSVLSKRQLPEQGTKQSLYRRLSAQERAARRICTERQSLRAGRGVLSRPRRPAVLLLLRDLRHGPPLAGAFIRWRYPSP